MTIFIKICKEKSDTNLKEWPKVQTKFCIGISQIPVISNYKCNEYE